MKFDLQKSNSIDELDVTYYSSCAIFELYRNEIGGVGVFLFLKFFRAISEIISAAENRSLLKKS